MPAGLLTAIARGGRTDLLTVPPRTREPAPRAAMEQAGRPGSLLGFLPDVSLADTRFRLSAGDVLLLYTDGATEARPRGAPGGTSDLFGQDALAAALAGCADLDAAGVITRLGEVLARHSGGWASDDTALLALRVPPAGRST
jgi:serine phosphatase RsbU (regulator of sigma subunit)